MTTQATIEDLARAADDAGAALADELTEFGDRLAPRRLVDDALGAVKLQSVNLARGAGSAVKAHPYVTVAALAAVGLAVFAGSRIAGAELDLDHDLDGYTDYDDTALSAAAAPAGDLAEDARAVVKDNPVVSILAGLAAGAALAMLFPSSAAEKRSLGALARRVTER